MHRIARWGILGALGLASCRAPAAPPGSPPARSAPVGSPEWIWVAGKPERGAWVYLRKEIQVKTGIANAKLYAAADDEATVFINGQDVLGADGAAPAFKDVTSSFVTAANLSGAGRHVLAVRARNNRGSQAGFLLRLVFESHAADPWGFVSDAGWRASARAAEGWNAPDFDDSKWPPAAVVAKLGGAPWARVTEATLSAAARLREPAATPPDQLKVAKGFKVELLYSVPKASEGSWVAMCVDPRGRLIVSDQFGPLYRVTLGPPLRVEKLDVDIGEAHGLLWAFDSLYVVVNKGQKYESGLYRVRDTDGDDRLDEVRPLRKLEGAGEHGPHAVLPSPDGKGLYVAIGNHTKLTPLARSRVPQVWAEDHVVPRMWDARGHARGILAPGGHILRTDPEGREWELHCIGFRNEYDAAFNREGELFTFDSDMEWDLNTPWYRPTRVAHCTSGAEFGWRSGSGKWPTYYPDNLPATVDIGPGSPTGVSFGTGAKFPAPYQEALYLCDWSYGKLYAVHLEPHGSTYQGRAEEFVTGAPLPLTDLLVHPDGAMYFTIGGRRVKSGLYRVSYVGSESTAPAPPDPRGAELRALRRKLEGFHREDAGAVDACWTYLGHSDRFIRFAARVAIEHQDPASWQERALSEKDLPSRLAALLALTRVGARALQPRVLAALDRLGWPALAPAQRLELLRVYGLAFLRMGEPDPATARRVAARFDPVFPSGIRELDSELSKLLVYLQSPGVAAKTLDLLSKAPTQEEQMDYVYALRPLKAGWTMDLRKAYYSWFLKAARYRGGASFGGFVQNMRAEAAATLTEAERRELRPLLEAKPEAAAAASGPPRAFVRKWTVDDLAPAVERGLSGRSFDRGRSLFAQAGCFSCHRFAQEGGATGPDLTGTAGRFSSRDLLESILEPSKVISDQYEAVIIRTVAGDVVTGRIVNLTSDTVMVNSDMTDPSDLARIDRKQIEVMTPSKSSMMPEGLLDTFSQEEILDLLAFLLSGGDRNHKLYR